MNALVLVPVLVGRVLWWALAGGCAVVWLVAGLVGRLLTLVGAVLVFLAEPADQWVTARLGMPAVLPRLHRLRRLGFVMWQRWRDGRSGVVEAELMEGVWR